MGKAWFLLVGLALAPILRAEPAAETEIRAQLTSRNATTLSAELAAVIKELTVRDGERFKKGQLLVAFDCSIQQAQLEKARATAQGAAKTYEVDQRLAKLESISVLEVDVAAAKLGEAKADVALTQAGLEKCKIAAPFDGRVAELKAQRHQHLKVGDPIMDVLDDGQLEVKMIVPSPWLRWLKSGQAFSVHIDELDRDFPAEVVTLGARIDPVSQTVAVVGRITGKHAELLAGMSGRAAFPNQTH
ncbi:efflux RND transporter periplasmic adaptor subunit [Methylomonas sp. UP202]|uniref:efflux RND transporter periplasmic adaptor subunit n=1 Tax=Methylomonas sp. UP202 TaxID=3040943 RepID=UPI00247ADB26|nr:efflux RND transporter periplasmic adaptor subunit [Methylomonas sp. UP202]WGS87517.1 efflux RND transporter periplasmic adaptor subunit [Methylomonas sp. UP202]